MWPLPSGYEFLKAECRRFERDHPDFGRNVLLMTRFDRSVPFLTLLDSEVRNAIRGHGLNPLRADDKMYMGDRNLWNNVCVYMLGCSKGIAILEDRAANEFNPNVAIEYGYMRALNRPTLLLADIAFRNVRADIVGILREPFDVTDIQGSVPSAIDKWVRELS
jgi:hypothetical protein